MDSDYVRGLTLQQKGVLCQDADFHSKNYAITGKRADAPALWAVSAKVSYFKTYVQPAYAGAPIKHLQADFFLPWCYSRRELERAESF